MNTNLQSSTKLTEFAPLQAEEKPQSVSQYISNFFKSSRNNEEPSCSEEKLPKWAMEGTEKGDRDTISVYSMDVTEGRSLPNVLKRISNLLAQKSSNLQDYKETELKQYWMPDSVSKECYECSEKFTTFRRRHHCRVCGQIFCSQCCNQQIPGKIFGCTGDLRVCTYCFKVVLSYLQSSDSEPDLNNDLKAFQEILQLKLGEGFSATKPDSLQQNLNAGASDGGSLKRKISVGYQEEKFASESSSVSYLSPEEKVKALQNSISLRNLFEEICKSNTGVPLNTHRYRLRTYNDCFMGSELVDWLIFQQKAKTRVQASTISQALLEGGYIDCLTEPSAFTDGYTLYKYGQSAPSEILRQYSNFHTAFQEEPIWIQQVPNESSTTDSDNEQLSPRHLAPSSSYMLDLNLEANTVYVTCSQESPTSVNISEACEADSVICDSIDVRTSEQREMVPESGWYNASSLRDENGEKSSYNILTETYEQHEQNLLKQLLSALGLSLTWSATILQLLPEIVNNIRPDKNHDAIDLDIRHYVQFKKIPGGDKSDTCFVRGIVCSKNIAHKDMQTEIENPKILLLQCAIVYQRTEGRLMSLEPVLMQEHEYLRHAVARIAALQPDVVLVQRNVSRLAQDFLRQFNIILVQNVKQSVLERLSRCTEADLVTAVDAHIGRPRLGTCKKFYLKKFNTDNNGSKTLMFFDGLTLSHLGGTVLLRGASKNVLTRVKKVANFMLFSSYNWRLEKSFLMDEFAQPPDTKCEFLDDSKENSPKLPATVFKAFTNETKSEPSSNNEKKITVEVVNDFTDPLQLSKDQIVIDKNEQFSVAELPFSNYFRKALDDTILCMSPYVLFPMPYLESDAGKKCHLRKFFPEEIYYSEQFQNNRKSKWKEDVEEGITKVESVRREKKLHPFLTAKITCMVEGEEYLEDLLADFRAVGGNYEKKPVINLAKCLDLNNSPKKVPEDSSERKDCLDPIHHQRLAVLFCSYSHESRNSPAFCVNPWVVYMDFYGRNDIPLGCFLERYCFRSTYMCPSSTCETPMDRHVRRFVHNSGCVSISLNNFDNEFTEAGIVMWTWCTKCQSVSPVVPMSADTWSFSFAKYLELKFHGDLYSRRGQYPCSHSLHHDHYQYFGFKNYVASFKYSSVSIWDISLPSPILKINFDTTTIHDNLIEEVKTAAQKGHEIFALIQDKLSVFLAEDTETITTLKQQIMKEQIQFKQMVEDVQLKLTSPTIENKSIQDRSSLYSSYWIICDSLVRIKKSIVDTVEQWNVRLPDLAKKKEKKDKSFTVDAESSVNFDDKSINSSDDAFSDVIKNSASLDCVEDDDVEVNKHQRSQSDGNTTMERDEVFEVKKESDKKTVKTILSQLLPSSSALALIPCPFNNQEHYNLPQGVYSSVVVLENEPSSIIAYTLNSLEYKKTFEEICKKNSANEQNASPAVKRKSTNSDKEKTDDEKSSGLLGFLRNKELISTPTSTNSNQSLDNVSTSGEKSEDSRKSKNSNVEVQFQDANCNFFCRVYLAEKFANLRAAVLPLGEEGYIRSLSRSVQWNARGGKSGSNFSKTTDDRFILKEMSKSEVQLFLESAGNYFTYMQRCQSTGQATLLGKILGVYQIIFKNNSNISLRTHLLVMENLFYNRTVSQKFDLKGSMRNRLVVPDNQEGEIVLLDENLLKMTCDSPLYILPHSKSVLSAAIQNDTEFLSAQSVMDYSLLVGLDTEKKELVLGIIDYIRTFTWDKKLETMVKKSGILGGQGKLPTIISPEEYQKRFIEAMHKYFLEVPDHWAGLGKGLESQ